MKRSLLTLALTVMLAAAPQETAQEQKYHQALEMVGVLSAAYLYQTYVNLGQLAEMKAQHTQPDSVLTHRLQNTLRILTGVHDNLKVFNRGQLTPEDSTYIQTLTEINLLLVREAGALKRYWQTGKPEDGGIYDSYNEQARRALEALYGIDLSP